MKRRKKFLVPTAKFSIIIENYNEISSAKGTTKSLRAKYVRTYQEQGKSRRWLEYVYCARRWDFCKCQYKNVQKWQNKNVQLFKTNM